MTERTSDPSHDEPDEAPEGFRGQPRYAPGIERAYANDRIEVTGGKISAWRDYFDMNQFTSRMG